MAFLNPLIPSGPRNREQLEHLRKPQELIVTSERCAGFFFLQLASNEAALSFAGIAGERAAATSAAAYAPLLMEL
jgi:hypothetical protein